MNVSPVFYNGSGTFLSPSFTGPFLSTQELLHTSWEKNYQLFIMPGGKDVPYHEALKGFGNRKIRAFVEEGNTYLGFCAGAYYGASHIRYNASLTSRICEKRELQFFKGCAVGPAFGDGTYEEGSSKGAKAALLDTLIGPMRAYFNGGCYFEGDFSNCRVLARYQELPQKPPAILECRVGKGKAILSGVHLEISHLDLSKEAPYLTSLIPLLKPFEAKRHQFYTSLSRGLPPIK